MLNRKISMNNRNRRVSLRNLKEKDSHYLCFNKTSKKQIAGLICLRINKRILTDFRNGIKIYIHPSKHREFTKKGQRRMSVLVLSSNRVARQARERWGRGVAFTTIISSSGWCPFDKRNILMYKFTLFHCGYKYFQHFNKFMFAKTDFDIGMPFRM